MKPNLKLLLAVAAAVGSAIAVAQDDQQPPPAAPSGVLDLNGSSQSVGKVDSATPTLAAATTPAAATPDAPPAPPAPPTPPTPPSSATPAPQAPEQHPLGDRHWRHRPDSDGATGQSGQRPQDGQRPGDGQHPGLPGEQREHFHHPDGAWQEGRHEGNRGPDGAEGPGHFQHPPMPPQKPVPFIGVVTAPVPAILAAQLGLPEDFGLVVEAVLPNSPAATAGLQRFDVLKLYNDQQIVDPRQLQILVRATGKDGSATITVVRKAQEQKVTVKIGEHLMGAAMHGSHHPDGAEPGAGHQHYAQADASHPAEHHPAEPQGDKPQAPGHPEHQPLAGNQPEHHSPDQQRLSHNGIEHHSFERGEWQHRGFGHHGFGREGSERQSSEHHGHHHHGFGQDGSDGENHHHQGFGHRGFGREGFGRQSSERHGHHHHGFGQDGSDGENHHHQGFGHHGFDREGFGRQSSEHHGHHHHGFGRDGSNGENHRHQGFGHHGFGREGFGRQSSEHHGFGHGEFGHERNNGDHQRSEHGPGHQGQGQNDGDHQRAPFDRSGRQPSQNRGPAPENRRRDFQNRQQGWHGRSSDAEPSSEQSPVEPANLLREIRPGGAAQIRVEHQDGSVVYDTANAKVQFTDAAGKIEIAVKDGHRTLLATDTKGETVFEGPIETAEQLSSVPEDIRKKLEWIESRTQTELVAVPAPAAPLDAELVQPGLADALIQ